MEYRYDLGTSDVASFLQKMHLAHSKINWIINDHLFKLDGNTLILDSSLFKEKELKGISQPLDILYRDDYLLIVNKPKGIIIYSDDENEVTLDQIVASYLAGLGLLSVPRHIYRLDRDTSGVMIYALDPLTLSYLSHLNETRELHKTYYALCHGALNKKSGTIKLPLGRNRHDAHKMIVSKKGMEAITEYQVLASNENRSLLALNLITGRTHQIRVHLAYLSHPVIGDKLYGIDDGVPLQLEVANVTFVHPITGELVKVSLQNPLSI